LGALKEIIEDHENLKIGKELEAGSHTVDSSWPKGAKNAKKRKKGRL
jgi:hypothetical protein